MKEKERQLSDLSTMISIVGNDSTVCYDNLVASLSSGDDKNDFWARLLVRCFTSSVETGTYMLKKGAVSIIRSRGLTPLPGEEFITCEVAYALAEDGKVRERPLVLRIGDDFRFGIRLMAKAINVDTDELASYDTQGWSAFKKVVDMRHKITHPRDPEDLTFSKADLKAIGDAMIWHMDVMRNVHKALAAADLSSLSMKGQALL